MTSGIVLGISLGFNDHAPEQAAVVLAFHQPAAHQIRGNLLCWAAEEGFRQGWEIFGDGQGGYGSGCRKRAESLSITLTKKTKKSSTNAENLKRITKLVCRRFFS